MAIQEHRHTETFRHTSIPQVTFETTIPMSEQVKTVHLGLCSYCGQLLPYTQCGFRHNRSTTDHIFCIRQILEKKWEDNEAVHQLFIDFKKGGRSCIIF
jgi:hypothetical protein